jgi:hypothetical protein
MTSLRYSLILRNIQKSGRLKKLFGKPLSKNRADTLMVVGQIMGGLWICLGVMLVPVEDWLSSSKLGIVIVSISIYMPVLIGVLILKSLRK